MTGDIKEGAHDETKMVQKQHGSVSSVILMLRVWL